MKKKLLLHVCCAPCASGCVISEFVRDFDLTLYFSNSNLNDAAEYDLRLEQVRRLCAIDHLPLYADPYRHDLWLEECAALAGEPERGERCTRCFRHSLKRTAQAAEELGMDHFATTLTVSPFKRSAQIFEVGREFPRFLPIDFKKKGTFDVCRKLTGEYGFYAQNYCGCEFSLRDRLAAAQKSTRTEES